MVEDAAQRVTGERLSRVFAALADPIRRDMVARLADGDATVTELAESYDVTLQAVSKHLRVLEDAGRVTRTREAQRRPVHLEAEVFDLVTKWAERYRRQAEQRYRRLDEISPCAGATSASTRSSPADRATSADLSVNPPSGGPRRHQESTRIRYSRDPRPLQCAAGASLRHREGLEFR